MTFMYLILYYIKYHDIHVSYIILYYIIILCYVMLYYIILYYVYYIMYILYIYYVYYICILHICVCNYIEYHFREKERERDCVYIHDGYIVCVYGWSPQPFSTHQGIVNWDQHPVKASKVCLCRCHTALKSKAGKKMCLGRKKHPTGTPEPRSML